MYRFAAASLVILVSSLTSAAQTKSPAPDAKPPLVFSFQAAPGQANCPVSLHAQQTGTGNVLTIRHQPGAKDENATEAVQRIHLVLGSGPDAAKVASLRVTVQGTSNKPRAANAAATLGRSPDGLVDAQRTLNLPVVQEEGKHDVSAEMVLRGFTSVTSIRLDSLIFTDGSVWTPEAGHACRVAPDPLMLISGR